MQQPFDDLFFDECYFDILPEPQQESSFRDYGERTSTLQFSQLPSGVQITTNQPYPLPVSFKGTSDHAPEHVQRDGGMKTGNNAVEVDVVAEFESWLESGAVDIV